ncbi:hypothetical protein CEXT_298901 [Caerostris extrusa]|uniref:Uncharacterized protein n=1 Tax=Caerostris extrusa TaxID=172846 RepID=A0AAV4UA16_CAEEX|nr:hypothetical protein CEXT_298901 [Caerostris extrusa]
MRLCIETIGTSRQLNRRLITFATIPEAPVQIVNGNNYYNNNKRDGEIRILWSGRVSCCDAVIARRSIPYFEESSF